MVWLMFSFQMHTIRASLYSTAAGGHRPTVLRVLPRWPWLLAPSMACAVRSASVLELLDVGYKSRANHESSIAGCTTVSKSETSPWPFSRSTSTTLRPTICCWFLLVAYIRKIQRPPLPMVRLLRLPLCWCRLVRIDDVYHFLGRMHCTAYVKVIQPV